MTLHLHLTMIMVITVMTMMLSWMMWDHSDNGDDDDDDDDDDVIMDEDDVVMDDDDVITDEVGGAASLRRLLNGECCDSSSFFVVGPGGQGILKHISSSKVRFQTFIFLQENLPFTKQMHFKKWGGGAALNTSKKRLG